MSQHVTKIRYEDYRLLVKIAQLERRDMTEIIHRALLAYIPTSTDLPGCQTPDDVLMRAPFSRPPRCRATAP